MISFQEDSENRLKIQQIPPTKLPPGLEEKSLAASVALAARGLVQHGVGDQQIDEKIGISHIFVLTHTHTDTDTDTH
jgi:hypothetical protein